MSPPPAEATVPANPATPNGITLDTPRKNPDLDVRSVVLGDVHFKTWYPSFYPDELVGKRLDRLYVCKWCFKYCNDVGPYLVHLVRLLLVSPFLPHFESQHLAAGAERMRVSDA